jgi:hypothetical protein
MFDNLIFDFDLETFIRGNSQDKIAMLLFHGTRSSIINMVGNYIKKEGGDSVSYLPKSRYSKAESHNPYSDGIGRVTLRIGRFARKFLTRDTLDRYSISPKDLEVFVNLFKSFYSRNISNLMVVEGPDILKWYLEYNYYCNSDERFGTLWNSCMRQVERNQYMKLYADNKDIKMVILLAEDGKLLGRALIWDKIFDSDNKEYKFMDRIYTIFDHDVNLFKTWAKQNGYLHKMEQNARSERHVVRYDMDTPIIERIILHAKLECHRQEYYPYLDTFKHYDPTNGVFSNSATPSSEYILIQSNGGLVPPPPPEEPEMEEEYDEDDEISTDW